MTAYLHPPLVGGGGTVDSIADDGGGTLTVDSSDPANPVLGVTPGTFDAAGAATAAQAAAEAASDPAGSAAAAQAAAIAASDPAGSASTVNTALGNHLSDTTDAHDASAVSFDPTGLAVVAATDVQNAIEELDTNYDSIPTLVAGVDIDISAPFGDPPMVTVGILPDLHSFLQPLFIEAAAADGPIQSDNTVNNDAELLLAVEGDSTYQIEGLIYYSGESAANFQCGFSGPAGATMNWQISALGTGATGSTGVIYRAQRTIGQTATVGATGGANLLAALIKGILKTTASGTLQFQWCQGTSNASNTTRLAGSSLLATKLA